VSGTRTGTKKMRGVGFHVKSSAKYCDSAAGMAGGAGNQSWRNLTRVMPNQLPGTSIKGIRIIRSGDIHDPSHDYRRNFKHAGAAGMEDRLGSYRASIGGSDVFQAAVASAGIVSIV